MKKPKSSQSLLFFSLTWEFLNEYLPLQAGRSPATIESYRDSLTVFRRYLTQERRISISKFGFVDCTKDCVFDFRDYLVRNCNQPSSINVRITALRAYLNFAADKDISIQSVAMSISKIPPCKVIQKEKDVLSEEALAAILSAPKQTKMGLRDRAMLITLYDSAVRVSELLDVRLGDINLDSEYPCILFRGKGNKERRVQITEKSVNHLKQYLQIFHQDSPRTAYLFSTTIKGKTDKMSEGAS